MSDFHELCLQLETLNQNLLKIFYCENFELDEETIDPQTALNQCFEEKKNYIKLKYEAKMLNLRLEAEEIKLIEMSSLTDIYQMKTAKSISYLVVSLVKEIDENYSGVLGYGCREAAWDDDVIELIKNDEKLNCFLVKLIINNMTTSSQEKFNSLSSKLDKLNQANVSYEYIQHCIRDDEEKLKYVLKFIEKMEINITRSKNLLMYLLQGGTLTVDHLKVFKLIKIPRYFRVIMDRFRSQMDKYFIDFYDGEESQIPSLASMRVGDLREICDVRYLSKTISSKNIIFKRLFIEEVDDKNSKSFKRVTNADYQELLNIE